MTAKITASADGTYGSLGVGANEAFRFGADNSGQLAGFRNKIINGGMQVAQRGGPFVNPAGVYTLDRWVCTGADSTITQQLDANTQENYLRISARTATCNVTQRIENVGTLAGKKATVSFELIAGVAPTTVLVYLGQNFGAGGSATIDGIGQTIVNVTNTNRTKYSVTFDVPSIAGKTVGAGNYLKLDMQFAASTGQSNLYNVQLEEGSIATPFEQRPIGLELSLCQRYYEVSSSERKFLGVYTTNLGQADGSTFKVTKRDAPVITLTPSGFTGVGYIPGSDGYTQTVEGLQFVFATPSPVGSIGAGFIGWTASAEL